MSTRILLVPGGTAIGAVALAHAGIHKLVELYEERQADPEHPAPHTVVVIRSPERVPPSTLRTAAADPHSVFPELAERIDADPHFFDGIDLVIETSGSSTGTPHLVGISTKALLASAAATHAALDGPGIWILALPTHHIAGAQVLLRSTAHDFPPRIVDTSAGFTPAALLPAIRGATSQEGVPAYLSLVPAQLRECLHDDEVSAALATLSAVLVGGQGISPALLDAARERGIRVHTTYGMTETSGGCVYNGMPLDGVEVRLLEESGASRLAIRGPMLMTRYLDGDSPFVEIDGQRWLLTGDTGRIGEDGRVHVTGRADDVIVSGGLSISPREVEQALTHLPDIEDAWVGALPDEQWGHIVAALVVPSALPQVTGAHGEGPALAQPPSDQWCEALRRECAAHIDRHHVPRVIAVTDALPLTGSGKVDGREAARILNTLVERGLAWRK